MDMFVGYRVRVGHYFQVHQLMRIHPSYPKSAYSRLSTVYIYIYVYYVIIVLTC